MTSEYTIKKMLSTRFSKFNLHQSYLQYLAFNLSRLSHYVPDSALLIVVGILLGLLLHKTQTNLGYYSLDSHTFFLYLLPPIIFDAGWTSANDKINHLTNCFIFPDNMCNLNSTIQMRDFNKLNYFSKYAHFETLDKLLKL